MDTALQCLAQVQDLRVAGQDLGKHNENVPDVGVISCLQTVDRSLEGAEMENDCLQRHSGHINLSSRQNKKDQRRAHFSQHVVPLVHHMPEVLIIQLICFVPSIKTCGSEDGQEARVIDTLLGPHNKKSQFSACVILNQRRPQINQSHGLNRRLKEMDTFS